MADEEQVERLKRSVPEWNYWKQKHPEIQPDLKGADLKGADLKNASLSHASLSHANLSGAYLDYADLSHAGIHYVNLSYADLNHADLYGANLSYTNLNHANLSRANLNSTSIIGAYLANAHLSSAHLSSAYLDKTDLNGANLSRASLDRADLSNTKLDSTDLSRAKLWHTVFAQNDLSTVKGLAEIEHLGPSRIELHSVRLPQDGSALHFLRGAGIPDAWIALYQAEMMHPIQYHSCFLSYSSTDEIIAQRLHADLQDQGVRCWFAPHNLRPGQLIRKGIDEAIHMQDKLLLILSEHSVKSGWVAYEVETALSREIRQQREILFPIRIDDAIFHCTASWAVSLRSQRHIGDFTEWAEPLRYQQVFERLLRDLKAQDAKPRKPE